LPALLNRDPSGVQAGLPCALREAECLSGGLSRRRSGGLPGDLHGCAPDPLANIHLQLRHSFLNPLFLLRASKGDKENFTEYGSKPKSVKICRKWLWAKIGKKGLHLKMAVDS
jgi:hypothetical protein